MRWFKLLWGIMAAFGAGCLIAEGLLTGEWFFPIIGAAGALGAYVWVYEAVTGKKINQKE